MYIEIYNGKYSCYYEWYSTYNSMTFTNYNIYFPAFILNVLIFVTKPFNLRVHFKIYFEYWLHSTNMFFYEIFKVCLIIFQKLNYNAYFLAFHTIKTSLSGSLYFYLQNHFPFLTFYISYAHLKFDLTTPHAILFQSIV